MESLQFAQIHLDGFNGVDVLHRPSPASSRDAADNDDVAGNQFLGLDERPVVNADAIAGVRGSPLNSEKTATAG